MKKAGLVFCIIVGFLNSNLLFAADKSHENKHYIGIFTGLLDADETDTTIGIEYEYKINTNWGVGALYEEAKDAHHGDGVSATIASAYYHPAGGWRLGLGIGEEKVGGSHAHDETLYRAGISYEFHLGENMGIEPSFNVDKVNGDSSQVYGVAFVWSF